MPRVRASDSGPYDFCQECFPSEAEALEEFGDVGDGPDERGNCFAYEDDHPNYDYCDYRCCRCRKPLTEQEDF